MPDVTWEQIVDRASLSIHPTSGVMLARIVWNGHPYTGVGGTSNHALHDLHGRVLLGEAKVAFVERSTSSEGS